MCSKQTNQACSYTLQSTRAKQLICVKYACPSWKDIIRFESVLHLIFIRHRAIKKAGKGEKPVEMIPASMSIFCRAASTFVTL